MAKPAPPRVTRAEELEEPRENPPLSRRATEERIPSRVESARNPEVLHGGDAFVRPEAHRTATAVEDRRQRVRAKVNYFACARSAGFGDDVGVH